MSTETKATKAKSPELYANRPAIHTKCALISSSGDVIACAPEFGPCGVAAHIHSMKLQDTDPWIGFSLSIEMESQGHNDTTGFGVRYGYDRGLQRLVMGDWKIFVRLPRDGYKLMTRQPGPAETALFPDIEKGKNWTVARVVLDDGVKVDVVGLGVPFSSDDDMLNEWANGRLAINGVSLHSFLRQREFMLVVAMSEDILRATWIYGWAPPPFAYPYGTSHEWDDTKLREVIAANKSKRQFMATEMFEDDNALLTVLTHVVCQDVLWVDDAVKDIAEQRHRAYFVTEPVPLDACDKLFVVIPLTAEFRDKHRDAWRRLVRDKSVKLVLLETEGAEKPGATWSATIIDNPSFFEILKDHPIEEHDMVLRVSLQRGQAFPVPIIAFDSRTRADAVGKAH